MKKAPSTILATAGITVGLLGVALPATASTGIGPNPITVPDPVHTTKVPWPVQTTKVPGPVQTTKVPGPVQTTKAPGPVQTTKAPGPVQTTKGPWPVQTTKAPGPVQTTKTPKYPGKPKGYHPGKPGKGHPAPKPKEVCHRVYTKAPHLTAQEQKKHPSWQQPKEGYVIKCTTVKPAVKKPVHHGPPPHHKAPAKKHPWWHFW
jgi:hypothetical protein